MAHDDGISQRRVYVIALRDHQLEHWDGIRQQRLEDVQRGRGAFMENGRRHAAVEKKSHYASIARLQRLHKTLRGPCDADTRKLLARIAAGFLGRSEEHTSELQSRLHLVCRLLLEKKKQ